MGLMQASLAAPAPKRKHALDIVNGCRVRVKVIPFGRFGVYSRVVGRCGSKQGYCTCQMISPLEFWTCTLTIARKPAPDAMH
jgi:hypothetical protein